MCATSRWRYPLLVWRWWWPVCTWRNDWARSTDGGVTWRIEGTLLPHTIDPPSANFLKLSLAPDGQTIYAYGTRYWGDPHERFGKRRGETVLCRSTDGGRTWTAPQIIPMPDCPLEISHSLRPLPSGRLLAPGATLASDENTWRRGLRYRIGRRWPDMASSPDGVSRSEPQARILGTEVDSDWAQAFVGNCVDRHMGDYRDQPDSFAISDDDGWTWSSYRSTGIQGQTMSTTYLVMIDF